MEKTRADERARHRLRQLADERSDQEMSVPERKKAAGQVHQQTGDGHLPGQDDAQYAVGFQPGIQLSVFGKVALRPIPTAESDQEKSQVVPGKAAQLGPKQPGPKA